MSFKVDNYKDIAIANFADSLRYYNIFERLEDVDILFRKVGITSLINEYEYSLSKTVNNGENTNKNVKEDFVYGMISLIKRILVREDVLYSFLTELLKKLETRFDIEDMSEEIIKEENIEILNNIKRNLAILGYQFNYQYRKDLIFNEEIVNFKLERLSDGVLNKDEDLSFVIEEIKTNNIGIYKSYKEAISNYSNGDYASCIRTCREVFENIFQSHSIKGNYDEGILRFTKEKATNGSDITPRSTQTDIFKYWLGLDRFKARGQGFDFYKLLIVFYSFMSNKGGHKDENVEISDVEALFSLRILEDILIWYYRTRELKHKK